jgi:hypothetical protein
MRAAPERGVDVSRLVSRAVTTAVLIAVSSLGAVSTASAVPMASATAAASAAACAYPTISFGGVAYCPATIVAGQNTTFGTGARVVLRGVTVTAVSTGTVTVGAWEVPPCPVGHLCGATLTLRTLTVAWTGTSRPAYGDVLDLFGRTVTASLTPVGYVKTGFCPIDWC